MAPSRRRASSKASSAAAARTNWKVGDLVLAKVKGFPAWPATVSEPEKWGYSADLKKVLVYFFGTKQIAFCNHADVEAFTEERKKSLLSKRHGKGADFVRALQEIVDCFEKSKELKIDGDINSGDEITISKNVVSDDPMGEVRNQIQPRSSMDIASSRLECLYISADSNGTHIETDAQAAEENGIHDMDAVCEEKVDNASSLDHATKKTSVAAYSRKRLIDAPVQSGVLQRRTSARKSRSTAKLEAYKLQNQLLSEIDGSLNTGDVLSNGTRNESAKRSTRVRKSPGTSVWHNMESPGYSASIAVNISSEDNGSELGASNSDTVSLNGGDALESSCKNEHPGISVNVMDLDVQTSDRFHLPAETFMFKKKRKPNRKRVGNGTTTQSVSPNRSPGLEIQGLEIQVEKTMPYSPNSCENLPDRFSRTNGDGHLPLLKRAWVRTGKPPSEKQLNELVGTEEESLKEVSVSNSEPMLSSSSCGNNFHDTNGVPTTNGVPPPEIEPTVIDSKCHLIGSVDAEPPLEKRQLNEPVCTEEESFKEVSVNNSELLLSSSSCGNYFHDGNGLPTTNGPPSTEKEPTSIPNKFHLCDLAAGEPSLEEKESVGIEEESSKEVLIKKPEPLLVSVSCGNDFRGVSGEVSGIPANKKEPTWVASKFKLRGSEYGEAALPPSKRLHRALEAMSANAAEEIQTSVDTRVTTNPISFNDSSDLSDKSSSHVSVDNEVGHTLEVQNTDFVGGNVNGESEMLPSSTSPTSELMEKPSSERKSIDSGESSNSSRSDECNGIVEFKNPVEIELVDNSSMDMHSSKTKVGIESPHPASSFENIQGSLGLGSRTEPMVVSSPSMKSEKLEIMGPCHEISNDILKLEHTHSSEDKLVQEQGASLPNMRPQDSSVANEAGFCSPSGDNVQLSVMARDSCRIMQSLATPSNNNVTSVHETLNESNYGSAERDTDVNSLKTLIAAAQAKRQLSLSTSLSDNVPEDMVVCNSLSSPSSVRRAGSDEQVSPSSKISHLSGDNRNRLLHNGRVDVNPKRSARFLEKEVENKDSPFSHRQKSLATRTNVEANVVRKSFESMLGSLTRTKESIGRATRLAIDCAKHGIAGEVLEILARNLETESSMHKRVDLFFLVDSITQCSRGQKGDIGVIFPSAVQAMLPRLLSAAAPPGNAARENRRQCLKVLKLWLERKTLPESVIRHHMRELDSIDASYTAVHCRRPLRMERALNDPIREMEGMQVDEYGSNASIQLPGFCMPCMVEEEGSDAEERSFEAVTPEQDPELPVERDATPTSTFERHCHILEDVDGELEMEDVAPSYGSEQCFANSVTAVDTLHHQFEQRPPVPFLPPLPADCPPTPPPLPASPPPLVPPLPSQSFINPPFSDTADLKFQPNTRSIQNLPHQHMSQRPDTTSLNSLMSDTGYYGAPGYRDWGKQSLRQASFSSSSSCRNNAASRPSVYTENNGQQIDGGSLHNNSYHLQPPPPTLSNQFSYVHSHQRRQSWLDASSSSFNKRSRVGRDMYREDILDNREKMELTPREIRERCRVAAPIHSVRVQSDNPESSYHPVRYGPLQESTRILDRGWSFPPRALNYQNPAPCIPPEAPTFWRPR